MSLKSNLSLFVDSLMHDDEGRMRTSPFLFSFCISILFFMALFLSLSFLMGPLDNLLVSLPSVVASVLEVIAPSILCIIPFLLCMRRMKKPGMIVSAFLWATGIVVALFILVLLKLSDERETMAFFLQYGISMLLVPPILVLALSWTVYRKEERRRQSEK